MDDTPATLFSKNGTMTRDELQLVPTPPSTNTHVPIPHYEVIQALVDTLGFRKISPVKEQYAVSASGNRLFGVMELENTHRDCRYALGIRNSHDKSLALGLTVGYKVLVCDNLAFHGQYTPMLRKHTKSFNLYEALSVGVDNIQRNFAPMTADIDRWKESLITDEKARLLIYECFVEKATDLPRSLIRPVHEYYFNPPHEEFSPRTLWSLNNAFSGAAKTLDPMSRQKAGVEIGEYFRYKNL